MNMKYIRVLPAELQTEKGETEHPDRENAVLDVHKGFQGEIAPNCVPLQSPPVPLSQNGSRAQSSAQPHPGYGEPYKALPTPCHIWQRSLTEEVGSIGFPIFTCCTIETLNPVAGTLAVVFCLVGSVGLAKADMAYYELHKKSKEAK